MALTCGNINHSVWTKYSFAKPSSTDCRLSLLIRGRISITGREIHAIFVIDHTQGGLIDVGGWIPVCQLRNMLWITGIWHKLYLWAKY